MKSVVCCRRLFAVQVHLVNLRVSGESERGSLVIGLGSGISDSLQLWQWKTQDCVSAHSRLYGSLWKLTTVATSSSGHRNILRDFHVCHSQWSSSPAQVRRPHADHCSISLPRSVVGIPICESLIQLQPGQSYTICVRALNVGGPSARSTPATVRTTGLGPGLWGGSQLGADPLFL